MRQYSLKKEKKNVRKAGESLEKENTYCIFGKDSNPQEYPARDSFG